MTHRLSAVKRPSLVKDWLLTHYSSMLTIRSITTKRSLTVRESEIHLLKTQTRKKAAILTSLSTGETIVRMASAAKLEIKLRLAMVSGTWLSVTLAKA